MRNNKEFTGKDLNEVLTRAAADLGIHQDEVHYRFIDEGRRGIMGLGARDVHIEVVLPATPEGKEPAPTKPKAQPKRNRSPRRQAREKNVTGPAAADETVADRPVDREEGNRGRKGKRGGRTGRKGRNRDDNRSGRESGRSGNRQRSGSRKPQPSVEADPAQMEQLAAMLRTMVEKLELKLDVAVEPVRTGVRVELTGDPDLLERNDAEFPQAMQFLLNRMSRRTWPDVGRIQLMSDRLNHEQDEELVEEIREVAGQIAHTGQPKSLHPMNPYERRIVHITVREFPGLRSESSGEGFRKRITISREDEQPAADDA